MTLAYDAVPWDRVEVGEDDRTLRVYGVTAPEGDRCWRLDRVRAEEHAEAVLVHVGIIEAPAGHPWSFRHGDPVEAEVRLRAPLAGRPIVPARWGSFMRADPDVPRASREQALPDRLLVPRPGILVVGWRGPIPGRLERVELRRGEGISTSGSTCGRTAASSASRAT